MKDKSVKGGFDTFGDIAIDRADKKLKKVSFTVRHEADTKRLLDELQWLKQFVITKKPVSQADIIREALELLAKKMKYNTLKEKYAEELADVTIAVGRKSGR